jgi:hypothetical protein
LRFHYKKQQLNAFSGILAVCSVSQMKYINSFCGQNAEFFFYVEVGGTHNSHPHLKCWHALKQHSCTENGTVEMDN